MHFYLKVTIKLSQGFSFIPLLCAYFVYLDLQLEHPSQTRAGLESKEAFAFEDLTRLTRFVTLFGIIIWAEDGTADRLKDLHRQILLLKRKVAQSSFYVSNVYCRKEKLHSHHFTVQTFIVEKKSCTVIILRFKRLL